MSRKIILIPVALLALIGIMFASSGLFPDTALFPRTPQSDGTIGGFLKSYFQADGTAKNTNMLSGVTASGYLQNNDCSTNPIDTVWVGVDADGRGVCGNTAGMLTAVPIGHFSEIYGTVNVIRSGTVLPVAALVNQDLYAGDIIQSDPTGTGTIAFHDDASLLRFFVDTDLELRYGLLGGNTVAEAILNDGSLWGRILTSTGVNIGGGGVVTGVRGTSVYITKTGTGYILNLVNSTSSANEVSKLSNTQITLAGGIKAFTNTVMSSVNMTFGSSPVPNTTTVIGSGTTVSYTLATIPSVITVTQNPALYLSTNQWIRDNTIADVEYMSNLLSGATNASLIAKLNAELDTTVMSGNTLVTQALLTGSNLLPANIASGAILLNYENQIDAIELTQDMINISKADRLNCKRLSQTYFLAFTSCAGDWDTLAMTHPTDFVLGTDYNLHGKKAKWNALVNTFHAPTNIISGGNNYIQYTNPTFLNDLKGKKVTITYTGSSLVLNKNLVFFGSSLGAVKWNGSLMYASLPISISSQTYNMSGISTVTITLPSTMAPTQFIIGNNSGSPSHAINATILSVTISD